MFGIARGGWAWLGVMYADQFAQLPWAWMFWCLSFGGRTLSEAWSLTGAVLRVLLVSEFLCLDERVKNRCPN